MVKLAIGSLVLVMVVSLLSLRPAPILAAQVYNVSTPNNAPFYGEFLGFGAEWDPFHWNANNLNRGTNQQSWDLITSRIDELDVKVVRMMMQLYWPTRDPNLNTWDWNNQQMQSVYKYLDFACAQGMTVILTDWGWAVRTNIPEHLYNTPTDARYAKGVAEYIKELVDRRGYSCIKYLILGNEPDNEIYKDAGMDAYVTMYRNVHQELTNNGMRSRIKLTGPDMGGDWDFMKAAIPRMKDILDTYDFHRYASTNETSNMGLPGTWESLWSHLDLWRGEVNSKDPAGANKLLLLTEMGNSGGGTNQHPQIDTFDYALHMADYGTTTLTTRVNAGIAWTMHDIYYFDGGQFMQWGMWKYLDNNWQVRPWGQSFGLLIKHAQAGSTRAQVNGTPPQTPALSQQRVAALQRPDGTWALFLVNRSAAAVDMQINLPTAPANGFDKYIFDRQTSTTYPNQLVLPPVGTVAGAKQFSITLPGETFVVLVEQNGANTCPADVTKDGKVDAADRDYLLARFFTLDISADISGDSIIDLDDYALLAKSYLQNCI